jgi:hypothetical protein
VTYQREAFDYKKKIKPIIERRVYTNTQSVKVEFIEEIEVRLVECKIDLEYQGNFVNYRGELFL